MQAIFDKFNRNDRKVLQKLNYGISANAKVRCELEVSWNLTRNQKDKGSLARRSTKTLTMHALIDLAHYAPGHVRYHLLKPVQICYLIVPDKLGH
jgi:hypothetical protein